MRVWLCETGWEEGSKTHHIYRTRKKAHKWKQGMKIIFKEKEILDKKWLERSREEPLESTNEDPIVPLMRFCEEHGIDTIDKWFTVRSMKLE